MSFVEKLQQASAALQQKEEVPWLAAISRILPKDTESISTRSVCDLLGIQLTTPHARKVAAAMRALGFVPMKSRRFLPGGFGSPAAQGWTKTMKAPRIGRPRKDEAIPPPKLGRPRKYEVRPPKDGVAPKERGLAP
jgi:hypothetical protein